MAFGVQWDPRKRVEAKLLTVPPERPVCDAAGLAHHWLLYVPAVVCALLAGFVMFVVPFWSGRFDPALLGLVIALLAGWLYLRVHLDRFVVTNLRIMRIQGVFNQHTAAMSLSRIVDFSLEEPFAGELLRFARLGGYGHLVFENAAQDQGLREIRFIPDAEAVDRTIQELVFKAGGGPGKHVPGSDQDGGDHDPSGDAGSDTDEIPVVRAPLLTLHEPGAPRRRWAFAWPVRRITAPERSGARGPS